MAVAQLGDSVVGGMEMAASDVAQGLPVGVVFKSWGRTITEGDFTTLSSLTWIMGRLHTNKEYMAKSQFGDRILAGGIVLALLGGLGDSIGLYDITICDRYGVELVALLGYENVRFHTPILPGDTIYGTFEIVEARATSKPERGILKVKGVATKQGDRVVAEATQVFLFERSK